MIAKLAPVRSVGHSFRKVALAATLALAPVVGALAQTAMPPITVTGSAPDGNGNLVLCYSSECESLMALATARQYDYLEIEFIGEEGQAVVVRSEFCELLVGTEPMECTMPNA